MTDFIFFMIGFILDGLTPLCIYNAIRISRLKEKEKRR